MTEPDIREQLGAIREGLRRAGREMVLSGWQAVFRGILVLAGCAVSWPLIGRPWWQMNLLWAGVVAAAVVIEVLLYRRLAARHPEKFVTGLERQLLKLYALVICAGAVLTAAALRQGHPEAAPGTWTLLVGLAYVAAGIFSYSRVWVLGAVTFVAGAAGLFLGPVWAFALLGLTLGLGSVAWGALLLVRREGADA